MLCLAREVVLGGRRRVCPRVVGPQSAVSCGWGGQSRGRLGFVGERGDNRTQRVFLCGGTRIASVVRVLSGVWVWGSGGAWAARVRYRAGKGLVNLA